MLTQDIREKLQFGKKIVIKEPHGKSVYRRIRASEARNYDGTSAGYIAGTPEGDRECVEKAFTPKGSRKTRYTNYW